MNTYPTINWWPGNLPPYESITSFLTRFCDLNRLTLNQAETYLGLALHRDYTDADVARVAGLLNEDPSIVRSVLMPHSEYSGLGHYWLPAVKTRSTFIRYCSKCVALGYHSSLHEIDYLQTCPFHLLDLQFGPYITSSGSKTQHDMKAIHEIMCKNSQVWPAVDARICAIDEFDQLKQFSKWLLNVGKAANQLSEGQIWCFGEDEYSFGEISFEQAMGQLNAICPIPEAIESLFIETDQVWELSSYKFSLDVKTALNNLRPKISFCELLFFYKKISEHSSNPPIYIGQSREAQAVINTRHGSECHCCWGEMTLGWYVKHWVQVDPDGWPHWALRCPYDVAVRELELGWGCAASVLSKHYADQDKFRFIQLSHAMCDAGLIENMPNAIAAENGHLYVFPQVWPCCEWNTTSPLTCLLNAVTELEVKFIRDDLCAWLDNLDKGFDPYTRKNLRGCVRVCENSDGILLLVWHQLPNASSTSENGYFQK